MTHSKKERPLLADEAANVKIKERYIQSGTMLEGLKEKRFDSFAFGSEIEVYNLCLAEFRKNSGENCHMYRYTMELKYLKNDHCVVSVLPMIHDWMEGNPISEKEAGRDGIGVEYLVCLKDMRIVDSAVQGCRARSFL